MTGRSAGAGNAPEPPTPCVAMASCPFPAFERVALIILLVSGAVPSAHAQTPPSLGGTAGLGEAASVQGRGGELALWNPALAALPRTGGATLQLLGAVTPPRAASALESGIRIVTSLRDGERTLSAASLE